MAFQKHVDEHETYSIDFSGLIADGAVLSSPEIKVVFKNADGDYVDKTTEFGDPITVAASNQVVAFELEPSSSDTEQDEDRYTIYCKVSVDTGQILVETVPLAVSRVAKI